MGENRTKNPWLASHTDEGGSIFDYNFPLCYFMKLTVMANALALYGRRMPAGKLARDGRQLQSPCAHLQRSCRVRHTV